MQEMMRSSGKCWLWSAFVFTGLLATITDAVPISHPTDEVPISHPERGSSFPAQTAKQRAETARWMAHQNTWGYVTRLNPSGSSDSPLAAEMHSFSDGPAGASSGRLWFYIMGKEEADTFSASLTMSQSAIDVNMTCVVHGIVYDTEDPMCAKMTVQGTMTRASLAPDFVGPDDVAIGKEALFARHPEMRTWPADHGFEVYELKIEDIWMIDFYGGGGAVQPNEYYSNEPVHNVPKWPPAKIHRSTSEVVLATFDGNSSSTLQFAVLNDPVMGGQSSSTVRVDAVQKVLVWQGKVAIVPFLHSPGFCTVRSKDGTSFPSLVETSALRIQLRNAGDVGFLTNFEVQIQAAEEPTMWPDGVYTAKFIASIGGGLTTVTINWSDFKFTWRGQPKDAPPLSTQLGKIVRIGVGTAGVAGEFDVHVSRFSAITSPSYTSYTCAPLPHEMVAARARWIVYHSLWTSVGTISVRLQGKPWGNVRSVADGVDANSTGLPVLYLPTPDPSSIDVAANPHVTLSFSEAALVDRVTPRSRPGMRCGGMDAEDPLCARLHMMGKLRQLSLQAEIDQAKVNLAARHPLAPWLATGGAHTGGAYYTLDVESLTMLDYYGGPSPLTLKEYLEAKPNLCQ